MNCILISWLTSRQDENSVHSSVFVQSYTVAVFSELMSVVKVACDNHYTLVHNGIPALTCNIICVARSHIAVYYYAYESEYENKFVGTQ